MQENERLAEMDIMAAVRPPNGNGLVTGPFTPHWGLLSVFGWKHVERGAEAWVCDGRVLTATAIARDLAHIIGHKQFIRRVVLNPEPLQVQARGKTVEFLDVALDVSIAYVVRDPIYVAALTDPLTELREAARGVIMQLMPAHTLDEFIQDSTGALRSEIKAALAQSVIFMGRYEIKEVLSVAPSGDSRFTDIAVDIQTAAAQAALIEQKGRNDEIAAGHDLAIQRQKLELEDHFKESEHERVKELKRIEEQGAIARSVIDAVAQLGASGAHRLDEIGKLLTDAHGLLGGPTGSGAPAGSGAPLQLDAAAQAAPAPTRGAAGRTPKDEDDALASIAEDYQVLDYHVFAEGGRITGATVKFRRCEIVFTADAQYPQSAPAAEVRSRSGAPAAATFRWVKDRSTLADAVIAILAKLHAAGPEGGLP